MIKFRGNILYKRCLKVVLVACGYIHGRQTNWQAQRPCAMLRQLSASFNLVCEGRLTMTATNKSAHLAHPPNRTQSFSHSTEQSLLQLSTPQSSRFHTTHLPFDSFSILFLRYCTPVVSHFIARICAYTRRHGYEPLYRVSICAGSLDAMSSSQANTTQIQAALQPHLQERYSVRR